MAPVASLTWLSLISSSATLAELEMSTLYAHMLIVVAVLIVKMFVVVGHNSLS